MIIRPEDYGAVADGIVNDAIAFWTAIKAAKSGDTVLLQQNKKYYIAPLAETPTAEFSPSTAANSEYIAAINLNGIENLTVRGDNTTILIEKPLFYCNINNTKNVTLDGLIFDYKTRPFAKANAISIDHNSRTVIMQTDRSLGIDKKMDAGEFGVLEKPTGRYHMYLDTVEPIDKEKYIYSVVFADETTTLKRLNMLEDTPFIMPMPNFAHKIERAFSIVGNRDFTMQNCKIYSMARFGFALFCNEGTVKFKNVRIEKAPDETADIVGWRDCFHVKENHASYIWDNCYAEYCYDDIFNISVSTLNVENVVSERELDLAWKETKGVYPGVQIGDKFSFIDYETGRDFGEAEVAQIVEQNGKHNHFKFKTPIINIKSGDNIKAYDIAAAAPGSVIKDCDFRGTFRFRGPIEIVNSHFYVARCWIDLCMPVEGPVPKHIHFTNCEFVCDDEENPYFHIVSQRISGIADNQYHIEDVVFRNCKLPRKTFEIAETDKPYVVLN